MGHLSKLIEKEANHKVTRDTTANFLDKLGDFIKAISVMVHPDKTKA